MVSGQSKNSNLAFHENEKIWQMKSVKSHLVQHETLKPLSQSATEWVVELQCHGGGALEKDEMLSCQINSG